MNYEFALEKKALISLVVGWIVISALLFLAGWIVGRQWPMNESTASATTPAEEPHAQLPSEPLLIDEPRATPKADVARIAKPQVDLPAAPPPSPKPAAASQAMAATGALAATPKNDGVVIISEAEPDAAANANAVEPEYVTVQVGVFLDQKEASHLLQQMERKGYAPTFFSGRDAEARQWYAVRIGSYSDKEQATKAAENFTRQEKIKAVVRPVESL